MHHNSFDVCRTTLDRLEPSSPAFCPTEAESEDIGLAATGIWLLASLVNHSGVANCIRSFVGDMQIIRATKDLAANTELRAVDTRSF